MSNKFQKIYCGFRQHLAIRPNNIAKIVRCAHSKINLWFYLATLRAYGSVGGDSQSKQIIKSPIDPGQPEVE